MRSKLFTLILVDALACEWWMLPISIVQLCIPSHVKKCNIKKIYSSTLVWWYSFDRKKILLRYLMRFNARWQVFEIKFSGNITSWPGGVKLNCSCRRCVASIYRVLVEHFKFLGNADNNKLISSELVGDIRWIVRVGVNYADLLQIDNA